MAGDVARPMWVRGIIPRRATRATMLVRCRVGVIGVVLLVILPLLVDGMPTNRWAMAFRALLVAATAWDWLAFSWVDRHRAWHRADA